MNDSFPAAYATIKERSEKTALFLLQFGRLIATLQVMPLFVKFCRLAALSTIVMFCTKSHALEIRFNNPFARDSGVFSFRGGSDSPIESAGSNESLQAARISSNKRVVPADNYLQALHSPRVAFADLQVEVASLPSERTSEDKGFTRFSDFLKLLDSDQGETEVNRLGKTGGANEVLEKVTAVSQGSDIGRNAEEAGFNSPPATKPTASFAIIADSQPGDRLFRRQNSEKADLGRIFFYFPAEDFDFESGTNYSPTLPASRFNHFTLPTQSLPRSSARFRTVP